MHVDHFRDLITRAVNGKDDETLDNIARQLHAAAEAHSILRAKGYGLHGMMIDATARQVPDSE